MVFMIVSVVLFGLEGAQAGKNKVITSPDPVGSSTQLKS